MLQTKTCQQTGCASDCNFTVYQCNKTPRIQVAYDFALLGNNLPYAR